MMHPYTVYLDLRSQAFLSEDFETDLKGLILLTGINWEDVVYFVDVIR